MAQSKKSRSIQILSELLWFTLLQNWMSTRTGVYFKPEEAYEEICKAFPHLKISQEEFDRAILPVIKRAIDSFKRVEDVRPQGIFIRRFIGEDIETEIHGEVPKDLTQDEDLDNDDDDDAGEEWKKGGQ